MKSITHEQVIALCSIAVLLLSAAVYIVVKIVQFNKLTKPKTETYEPHAGKTLGL